MPESNRKRRGHAWRLSNANDVGQLVRVECGHCNIKRDYLPSDLLRLFGDVDAELVSLKMRCEKCRHREHLRAATWSPTGRERVGLRIRRLEEVRMVRKVIWRDEQEPL